MKFVLAIRGTTWACMLIMTWHAALVARADCHSNEFAANEPPITAVAIDEKNGWAIEGSQAGLVVRSWPDLKPIRTLPTKLEHIHDISLSPDGTVLAVAGGSPAELGAAELYRWPSGDLWKRLEPHEDLVYAVAWRDDSKLFALASADKTVKTFTQSTAECVNVLEGHSRPVLAAEFLPGELGIVTAGADESLRFWKCSVASSASGVPERTFTNHTRQVFDLALRPSEGPPVIASIGEDSTVRLWQPTIGRMMRFAKLDSVPLAVCWVDNGMSLAVACRDGKVRMVNPDTVEVTLKRDALSGSAYCIAADSSGSLLVGGVGGQLKRLSYRQ